MYSLEDALRDCDKELLLKGILSYEDDIPSSSRNIDRDNPNYHVMRCYEGLISAEEFAENESAKQAAVGRLYKEYIFKPGEVLSDEFVILDKDIDDLIYLRMAVSQNSEYLEQLDKLMLRIHFEKRKTELAGLVQHIYEKYDWAKKYIQNQKENELSLIFREGTDEYKMNFGICEEADEKPPVEETKGANTKAPSAGNNYDWISKKFGG